MNNNGSVMIYSMMIGLVILVLALALAPSVQQATQSARNGTQDIWNGTDYTSSSGLNCSSSTISIFDKSACIATDLNLFYFIGGLIFIAGAFVGTKVIFGGES